jgi:hypothetical protein
MLKYLTQTARKNKKCNGLCKKRKKGNKVERHKYTRKILKNYDEEKLTVRRCYGVFEK